MTPYFQKLSAVCGILVLAISSMAQAQVFEIRHGSALYDASIETVCKQDDCDGAADISLFRKGSAQLFQKFYSDELTMYLDEKLQPSVNVVQLYGEQSPLIFQDMNFDGSEDLAIRNGNYGAYGGPVYDIYVFNRSKQKFVFSEELSVLTQENLGMFAVDQKLKRIITFNKSGCCYHIRSEYRVIPQKGLQLVREFIEAVVTAGDKVEVTDRKLVKGKWKEQVRYYPIDQYYKN